MKVMVQKRVFFVVEWSGIEISYSYFKLILGIIIDVWFVKD